MPELHRRGRFDTTSWSLIVAAAGTPQTRSDEALAELCARYWYPVYAFIRRHHPDHSQAEDLTQSFFTRLIEKNYVGQADRTRGRFRTFMLTAVRNFLLNERDHGRTQKRGGGAVHVDIDSGAVASRFQSDAKLPLTPEQLFHKRWALTLLEDAMADIRRQAAEEEKLAHVDRLLPFVTGDAARSGYGTLAKDLGTTEGALRVAVHRLRMRFRERLREAVAATLTDPADLDDEIRFLIDAVSIEGGVDGGG